MRAHAQKFFTKNIIILVKIMGVVGDNLASYLIYSTRTYLPPSQDSLCGSEHYSFYTTNAHTHKLNLYRNNDLK